MRRKLEVSLKTFIWSFILGIVTLFINANLTIATEFVAVSVILIVVTTLVGVIYFLVRYVIELGDTIEQLKVERLD